MSVVVPLGSGVALRGAATNRSTVRRRRSPLHPPLGGDRWDDVCGVLSATIDRNGVSESS